MNLYRQALYAALSPVLRADGYERRGPSWYRSGAETTRVVNLDKSTYGQQFYVNLAVALRGLSPDPFPAEHHCHVRFRLDEFVPDKARLQTILDFDEVELESEIGPRALEVAQLIRECGLAWLASLGTEVGVRTFRATPSSRRGLVTKAARDRLGIPEPS